MSPNMVDYRGEDLAPPPVSETIQTYLRKSISIADILKRLSRGWSLAMAGALMGVVVGLYLVWITPPSYTVTLTLLPLEQGSADINGGGGTGLAALAGLLGTSGPVPKFTRFAASFYSTGLARLLDRRYDMICITFGCDPKTRQWPKHTGFDGWMVHTFAEIAHLPNPDRPRTAYDLAQYISSSVTIAPDKNTGMLALSVTDRDPKKASDFLVHLVQGANDYVKNQDNEVVKKQLAYVTEQLKTNTDLSQRDALTKMLAEAEQHLMLTAIDIPYVAAIEDGPTPEISNGAIKYISASILLGVLLGGGLGIALSFVPKEKRVWRRLWTKV